MSQSSQKATAEQLEKIGDVAAGLIKSGDRVGLGSGKAALAFVRALGQRIRHEGLNCLGVSTSLLTSQVAQEAGVPLAELAHVDELDIAIDGADEVDPRLDLLKGGGGNITREMIIAKIAKRFVIVVGQEKMVPALGTGFPVFVEVLEFARPVAVRAIQKLGGQVTQRMNADGTPFMTDNNNPYLHASFGTTMLRDPSRIQEALKHIPGVVETGLFVKMADEVIIARFDGTIERKTRQ